MPEDSDLIGATLGEVEAAAGVGFLIVALQKSPDRGGEVLRRPPAGETLAAGDALIVLGYGRRAAQAGPRRQDRPWGWFIAERGPAGEVVQFPRERSDRVSPTA